MGQKEKQALKEEMRAPIALLRSALRSAPFAAPEMQYLQWEKVEQAVKALEELAEP